MLSEVLNLPVGGHVLLSRLLDMLSSRALRERGHIVACCYLRAMILTE